MKKKKKIEFDLLYPQVWNQYNVYHQSYEIYNNRINSIGVVASVFIAVLIAVPGSWTWLRYLPIIGLLIPPALALYSVSYKKVKIPWFDKKQLVKNLQCGKQEYYEALIDDVYQATGTLLVYKRLAQKLVSISVWAIVISVISALTIALCQQL